MSPAKGQVWIFRLYIAGAAPNSRFAIANLETIRQDCLPDGSRLEIVDILQEPQRAFEDGILVTPTLVRLSPLPVCKIVGNLSERSRVLQALGLPEGHN